MACCYGCVKYTLFLINLFVTVVVTLVVAFGVYAFIELKDFKLTINATHIESLIPDNNALQTLDFSVKDLNITDSVNVVDHNGDDISNVTIIINDINIIGSDILGFNPKYIGLAIIVLGCIIFWIAFFGCCGSICANKCLLGLYTLMMLLLAGAQIYLCIAVYDLLVIDFMELIISAFKNQEVLTITEAMVSCCGTNGPDYYNSTNILPPTCCGKPLEQTCSVGTDSMYPGCNAVIKDGLVFYVQPFRIILVIAIGCELLTASMAIYLMCSSSKRNKREKPIIWKDKLHNNYLP